MKKKLSILISLIVVLGIIVGVTLAMFGKNVFDQNVSFNVGGGITITYNAGNNISGIKLIPVTSLEKGLTDNTVIEKTITVSSNQTAWLSLYMDIEVLDNGLKRDYVVWEIKNGNSLVNSGNFANSNANDTVTILDNVKVNGTTSTYTLYIWIDGTVDNDGNVFNQNYEFVLRASATNEVMESGLPDFILNSNAPVDNVNSTYVIGIYDSYTISNEDKTTLKAFIMNDGMNSEGADLCIANEGTFEGCLDFYLEQYNQANDPDIETIGAGTNTPGIDFISNASDTNGKGLYIRGGTENNINPIYYYRGAVDNNNVYFANYCWKIVRTTETGGLKMIYNGTPTSGSCGSGTISQDNSSLDYVPFNNNLNSAKYVGYTYDNNGVETDSTIKGIIDTWYQTNILANYDSYIEDTVYCNDRREANAIEKTQIAEVMGPAVSSYTLYKPTARLFATGTPSLNCVNNEDKYTKSNTIGNGKLTYPVGLLTMDEVWLAGEDFSYVTPSSSYLELSNRIFWLLSPCYFAGDYAFVWSELSGNGLSYSNAHTNEGVRPVISLKPGQNFEYGNGTGANPYRFVATVPSS